ncbi:MAG: hypothetical protein PF588_07160 [Candidatus Kapabacteria bacterium]|jgi:hypothetical protein|nr:hypothetical protein [Candidatus Kapabacteria bacterium]
MTDYTKLIHDFVDGTLDSAAESELFTSISANEGLRTELKEQLAIKDAVRNDTMAYSPSASSTTKVFSTLGFFAGASAISGAAVTGAATSGSTGGFLAAYGGKLAASIIAGLASAVLTAAIIFSVLPDSDETSGGSETTDISLVAESTVSEKSELVNNEQSKDVPTRSGFANAESNNKDHLNNRTTANNNSINSNIPLTRQESTAIAESSFLAAADNNKHNSFSDVADNNDSQSDLTLITPTDLNGLSQHIALANSDASEQQTVELPQADNSLDDMLIITKLTPWSIEFRSNDDMQLHRESVMPAQHNLLNNTALGVYYALSDQFSLGVEYRRENFMQKFDETDANGIITIYEQQPNFNSYGAAFRYIPKFARIDSWDMQTITQLSAGMTFSGENSAMSGIGRIMIAERYAPYPELAFIVGLEGSVLAYQHVNSMFRDYKLGFFYGI